MHWPYKNKTKSYQFSLKNFQQKCAKKGNRQLHLGISIPLELTPQRSKPSLGASLINPPLGSIWRLIHTNGCMHDRRIGQTGKANALWPTDPSKNPRPLSAGLQRLYSGYPGLPGQQPTMLAPLFRESQPVFFYWKNFKIKNIVSFTDVKSINYCYGLSFE